MVNDPTHLKHIYWRSRRGMLELELKLVPFVRDCFETQAEDERIAYEAMLEEEDWQIYDWLQRRASPSDLLTRQVVDKIIAYRGAL
jgi:antitoxin CptB